MSMRQFWGAGMETVRKLAGFAAVSSLLVVLPGCGGGTMGTSGDGFHSGYSADLKLNQLSTDETKKLCEKMFNFVQDVFDPDNLCKLAVAVAESQNPPAPWEDADKVCKEATNKCLDEISQLLPSDEIKSAKVECDKPDAVTFDKTAL